MPRLTGIYVSHEWGSLGSLPQSLADSLHQASNDENDAFPVDAQPNVEAADQTTQ